jgi:hypothetical protein
VDSPKRRLGAIGLVAAVFLLNASLTFESAWPTPGIRWRGAVSAELAALLLVLAAMGPRCPRSRRWLRWTAAVWLLLVAGHYGAVSAAALYGREINLFWDLRFVPDVVALLAGPERLSVVLLAVVAVVLALALVHRLFAWALERVCRATAADGSERRAIGGVAVTVLVLWLAVTLGVPLPGAPAFSPPVTGMYARQARLFASTLKGSAAIAPSPPMNFDLSHVAGADVLLFFIEAYGSVTYDRPEFANRLAADRSRLETAIHETGRDVVSAYVESPTFGGSSWLAHVSLLSGVEVKTHDANALLMSQKRDTLVSVFKRGGYRTVAFMPGTWQEWPEGQFYGFDAIYGGEKLGYHGPPFGWWDMTDQFTLAQMDRLEVDRAPRGPLFVLFPTISTHIPFTPTPPYQPDWDRMLTDTPYDVKDLETAYDRQPDWLDLGPSYADAVSYEYRTLEGYVRKQAGRDVVIVLIGDHQPAAAVSGRNASWDVPVHVIATRRAVLDRLERRGFRPGMTPQHPGLGPMHGLTPVVLEAFGEPRSPSAETANKH